MPNDAGSQQCLAEDPTFRRRVKDALNVVAWQIIEEDPATPAHSSRATFARSVLSNLDGQASVTASWIVNRTNLFAAETTYDFDQRATITAAADADIQSQISTDWNVMAGILDPVPPPPPVVPLA